MIISHGRRYVFVHIPKTGGTSLALALESKAMKDDILIGDTPKAKQRRKRVKDAQTSGRLWKHSRLTDIYGLVDQEQIEQYFVFTIVRNPWDRVVSYYHWLRQQSFEHPAVKLAGSLDFTGFLQHRATRASLANDGAAAYVTDAEGQEQCNLFLRLESLDRDLPRLEAGTGLKLPAIPHENKSGRGDYRNYYADATAGLIANVFAADIDRFGYKFE